AEDRAARHVGQLDQVVAVRLGKSDAVQLPLLQLSPQVSAQFLLERAIAAAVDLDPGAGQHPVVMCQQLSDEKIVKPVLALTQRLAIDRRLVHYQCADAEPAVAYTIEERVLDAVVALGELEFR